MKKNVMKLLGIFAVLVSMLGISACSTTETANDGFGPKHKLVIQVNRRPMVSIMWPLRLLPMAQV